MAKLGILDRILPPDDEKFYIQFEAIAKICSETAQLFDTIVHSGVQEENHIIEAKRLKHASSALSKETLNQLNATFITPIDREDIQLLNMLLNKITKKIVKACLNLRVYRLSEFNDTMKHQAETLVQSTKELTYIVSMLRNIDKVKEITESHYKMKEIETHGDEILYKAMDDLFSGKYDALSVIKLRDIYKDIENALDNCYGVSDTILNIVLKHS